MNPFKLTPYAGKEFFCDRVDETKHITSAIKSKRNLTLHAIRRQGKTGLIMHVHNQLPKKYIPIYIDIYDTTDETAFANKLIAGVVRAMEEKKSMLNKALGQFARFRATVIVDPTFGTPTITLDLKDKNEVMLSLQLLWSMIREDKKHIYQIAIDEFQQIETYKETNIDATLREASQTIPNIHFIFSGSQKHLLTELFSNVKKPLFRTTELMELHAMPYPEYMDFIQLKFKENDKAITETHVHQILKWTKMHTFYVQYFCHMLFEKTEVEVKDYSIEDTKKHIYLENEHIYYQFKKLLTSNQWSLLSAIANEGILREPNSNAIRNLYKLGNGSTISRSLTALLDKEMVYSQFNEKGKMEYQVYDVFLSRWISYKGI